MEHNDTARPQSQEPMHSSESTEDAQVVRFSDVVRFLWSAKYFAIGAAFLCGSLALSLSYLMTPMYEAGITIIRAEANSGGVQELLGGGLGGFAALAGIGGQIGKAEAQAEALLTSGDTIGKFIDKNDLLPRIYRQDWDPERKMWKQGPLPEERRQIGIRYFKKGIVKVQRERSTGIIRVSVRWTNRTEAQEWANGLITFANEMWGKQLVADADLSIKHLTAELEATTSLEIRDAIYRLIEANMKQRTVAVIRQDLLFRTLERAVTPLPKDVVSPKPLLMTVVGGFVGGILGILIAFIRLIWR